MFHLVGLFDAEKFINNLSLVFYVDVDVLILYFEQWWQILTLLATLEIFQDLTVTAFSESSLILQSFLHSHKLFSQIFLILNLQLRQLLLSQLIAQFLHHRLLLRTFLLSYFHTWYRFPKQLSVLASYDLFTRYCQQTFLLDFIFGIYEMRHGWDVW